LPGSLRTIFLTLFAAATLVAIGPQSSLGNAAAKVIYVKADGFDYIGLAVPLGTILLAVTAIYALDVAKRQLSGSNNAAKIQATLTLMSESSQGELDWAFTFFDVGVKARNSRAAVWTVWEELVVRRRPPRLTESDATRADALALSDFRTELGLAAGFRLPTSGAQIKRLEDQFRLAIFAISNFSERACIQADKDIIDCGLLLEHCDWKFAFTYYALEPVLHDLYENEEYVFEYFLKLANRAQKRYAEREEVDEDVAHTVFREYRDEESSSAVDASPAKKTATK